jgi:hypothetical protein
MNANEDPLMQRVREQLDRETEDLDGATQSRLRQARERALAQVDRSGANRWWVPTAGLATAAAVVLALGVTLRTPQESTPPDSALGDLEMLASSEDLEMLDDLEFLLWLEAELEENG